jgi:hypothetical protein
VSNYLRLRQICLAAPMIEALTADICDIFKVAICYRDPGVAKYGLVNALIPIGTDLLEVVCPTEANTAAGRFISKTRGHGGYMAIFQTNNPRERQAHAATLGVRTAHTIERPDYQNAQLHPRDCRATFIEVGHSVGGDDRMGTWWPAGDHWKDFIRTNDTRRVLGIELESLAPDDLATHWSKILQTPLGAEGGAPSLRFEGSTIWFVQVADVAATLERALERGYRVEGDAFHMGGVYFRVRP